MRINKIRISLLFASFFVMNKTSPMSSGMSDKDFSKNYRTAQQDYKVVKKAMEKQLSFVSKVERVKSSISETTKHKNSKLTTCDKIGDSIRINMPITHKVGNLIYETCLSVMLDYSYINKNIEMQAAVNKFAGEATEIEKNYNKNQMLDSDIRSANSHIYSSFFSLVESYAKKLVNKTLLEVEAAEDVSVLSKNIAEESGKDPLEQYVNKYFTGALMLFLDFNMAHIVKIGEKSEGNIEDLSKHLLKSMNVSAALPESGKEKKLITQTQAFTGIIVGVLSDVSKAIHQSMINGVEEAGIQSNIPSGSLGGQVLKKLENEFKNFNKFPFTLVTEGKTLQECIMENPSESVLVLASCIPLANIFQLEFCILGEDTSHIPLGEFCKLSLLMSNTVAKDAKDCNDFYKFFTSKHSLKSTEEIIPINITSRLDVFTLQFISLYNSISEQEGNTLIFTMRSDIDVNLRLHAFNNNVTEIMKDNGIILSPDLMKVQEVALNPYIAQQHSLAKVEEEAKKGAVGKFISFFKKDTSKNPDKKDKKSAEKEKIFSPYGGKEEITEIKTVQKATVKESTIGRQFIAALFKVLGKDINKNILDHLMNEVNITKVYKDRSVQIHADYALIAASFSEIDTIAMDKLDADSVKVLFSIIGDNLKNLSLGILDSSSISLINKEYEACAKDLSLSSIQELNASFDMDCAQEEVFKFLISFYMDMAIRSLTCTNNISVMRLNMIVPQVDEIFAFTLDKVPAIQVDLKIPADLSKQKTKNIKLEIKEAGGNILAHPPTTVPMAHHPVNITISLYVRERN